MITPMVDSNDFHQQARQIRARVPVILSHWGLPQKFSRWRLTQDPDTGLVVLFAVLNNKHGSTDNAATFSGCFEPRVLQALADDLRVQVVSCKDDAQRYAFILDRGSFDRFPTHLAVPFLDGDRLLAGVVYEDQPVPGRINVQSMPALPIHVEIVTDHTRVSRGVGAFLKVFDDIRTRDDAALAADC